MQTRDWPSSRGGHVADATAVRPGDHRRADQPRRPRPRARARLAQCAAGLRGCTRRTGSACSGCTSASTSGRAGFLALGLAKASGAPVAVLTTSGTAAANLHPAVLEAWHAHQPLMHDHRQPAAFDDQHRGQPDHRPRSSVRPARPRASPPLSDQVSRIRATWRFETAPAGSRRHRGAHPAARPGAAQRRAQRAVGADRRSTGRRPGPSCRRRPRARAGRAGGAAGRPADGDHRRRRRPDRGREIAAARGRGAGSRCSPSRPATPGSARPRWRTGRLLPPSSLAEEIERVVVVRASDAVPAGRPAAGPDRRRAGRGLRVRGLGRPRAGRRPGRRRRARSTGDRRW